MIKKTLTAALSLLCLTGMAQNAPLPKPDHVVVVVMENTAYGTIINSDKAPYIKSLANDPNNALFTNSYGMTHPSQPNYIYMFSGTNQGVTDNKKPSSQFTTPNLGAELIKAGYTFAGYSEALPSEGSLTEYWGGYARKHSPWTHWQGTGPNQLPPSTNKTFEQFPADFNDLPTVSYVIPTLTNDMHDPPYTTEAIQNGDNWIKNNLGAYAEWCKTHNSLLIITWDEDDAKQNNQIVTIVIGEPVQGGKYSQKINHVNMLRTLEEMYGLGYAGNSANVSNIGNIWKEKKVTVTGVADNKSVLGEPFSIYPNPAKGKVSMQFNTRTSQVVHIVLHDELGRVVRDKNIEVNAGENKIDIGEDANLATGVYIVTLEASEGRQVQKVVVEKE